MLYQSNRLSSVLCCLLVLGAGAFLTPQFSSLARTSRIPCNGDIYQPRNFVASPCRASHNSSNQNGKNLQSDDTSNVIQGNNWRRRFRKRSTTIATSTAFALSIFFRTTAQSASAAQPEVKPMPKLRPGVSMTELQDIERKNVPDNVVTKDFKVPEVTSSNSESAPSTAKTTTKETKKKETKKTYDELDYGDEDDEEYSDFEFAESQKVPVKGEKELDGTETPDFSPAKKGKYVQATAFLTVAIPFFGYSVIRENIRGAREQRMVKKGIEIIEAQKAEYFNITNAGNETDADITDELKDLKDKDDDDDDEDSDGGAEDDDEDDDDDDDDTPPSSPKRPSPRGGGDLGGGDSSGGDDEGPSEEDLDRLNSLFNKS